MSKIWPALILACCIYNGISMVHAWIGGEPADWAVWLFAVAFSVNVALDAIGRIIEPKQ